MIDVNDLIKRVYNKMYIRIYKRRFAKCGDKVVFSPYDSQFSYENIQIGNNVYIGNGADMIATRSQIKIGDHVVFGPKVSIRGGDHRTNVIGKYIDEVDDSLKLPENDEDVIFEGDNWIGMNTTILKGVTVARGSIIAAGSVVTKSTKPYSIVGGVPARFIRYRFTEDEICTHELILSSRQDNA